jgi:hypothetical protein
MFMAMLNMEFLLLKGLENAFKHSKKQGVESKLYLPMKKIKSFFGSMKGPTPPACPHV